MPVGDFVGEQTVASMICCWCRWCYRLYYKFMYGWGGVGLGSSRGLGRRHSTVWCGVGCVSGRGRAG